jgi:hypothetical protein
VGTRSAAALALSIAAIAAAPCGPAAAQSPASEPALSASYPCYGGGESVLLSGSGFTPAGRVTLSASGQQLTTLGTDPDGAFTVRIEAPEVFGVARLRFSATDRGRPTLSAATTVRIAATDVLVTPAGGPPNTLRRIRAWGFMDVRAVYAHVKRPGRRARNIRLGAPRGPCGVLDVKRRLFRSAPRAGVYELQFDSARRYIRDLEPSVGYLLAVFRPAALRATATSLMLGGDSSLISRTGP